MLSRLLLACALTLSADVGHAASRIAILDFELKDLTLAPGIPAEIKRTASIKPLLESELRSAGYQIIDIPADAQQAANSGVGYLFDHADAAAELGKSYGADYVVAGRLHKPSFLFAYLMANLVRVGDSHWMARIVTESKGPNAELVIKAVESLADKIDDLLENRYEPPPPNRNKQNNPN
ncbi:DUF2380 domain-containing protein [Methylomonas sp. MgM2]